MLEKNRREFVEVCQHRQDAFHGHLRYAIHPSANSLLCARTSSRLTSKIVSFVPVASSDWTPYSQSSLASIEHKNYFGAVAEIVR